MFGRRAWLEKGSRKVYLHEHGDLYFLHAQLLLENEVAPVEGASSSSRDGMEPPPVAVPSGAAVEEVPLAGEAQEA
eukprot:15239467-Alexandrium_andersonii.AAC.1